MSQGYQSRPIWVFLQHRSNVSCVALHVRRDASIAEYSIFSSQYLRLVAYLKAAGANEARKDVFKYSQATFQQY